MGHHIIPYKVVKTINNVMNGCYRHMAYELYALKIRMYLFIMRL